MPDNEFAKKPEAERQQYFIDNAGIEGAKIVKVEYLGQKQTDEMGWSQKGMVLVLDNGKQVWVQSDDEGNNAGMLVVIDPDGKEHPIPNF